MASGLQFALLLSGLLAVASCCEGGEKTDCFASCPPGWTQFHCHCYFYHARVKNWPDAERHCLSLGGNLAPVHNAEEHNFIRNYMFGVTGRYSITWIGGHDGVQEGMWMWSDGSVFDFQAWYNREPNNLHKKEHCLEMNFRGATWNDRVCTATHPFICAQDAKHSPCCHGDGGHSDGKKH